MRLFMPIHGECRMRWRGFFGPLWRSVRAAEGARLESVYT